MKYLKLLLILIVISCSSFAQDDEQDPLIKNRIYSEVGLDFLGFKNGVSVGPRLKVGANVYYLNRYQIGYGINFSVFSASLGFAGKTSVHGTIPSIGPSFIFRITELSGIEVNLPIGYGGYTTETESGAGLSFIPEIKWRKEELSFGLHYTGILGKENFGKDYFDSFSITVGFKFDPQRFINRTLTNFVFVL